MDKHKGLRGTARSLIKIAVTRSKAHIDPRLKKAVLSKSPAVQDDLYL